MAVCVMSCVLCGAISLVLLIVLPLLYILKRIGYFYVLSHKVSFAFLIAVCTNCFEIARSAGDADDQRVQMSV